MRTKTLWTIGVVVMLCALASGQAAWAAPTISLTVDNATPAVGGSFTVTVNLAEAAPFACWGEYLKFDPTKVQFVSQAAGTFSTFVADSRGAAAINAAGDIRAGGFSLADNAGGSGTLGVFTFQALATGATSITTEAQSVANPFGDALLTKAGGTVLPGIAGPLSITVGPDPKH